MKTFLRLILCLAILAPGSSAVNAQGLGGLINKGKAALQKGEKKAKEGSEVIGKILGTEETASENAFSPEAITVNVVSAGAIGISNPVSPFIAIEPVGLYGISTSENFGNAYLVLNVTNLIPKEITRFGSSVQNQKMMAVDNNGKVYNIDSSGHFGYDTPEGLTVRIVLDEPGLMFTNIRKDVGMMQQVKFGVFSDAQHQGNVILTNVPIFWDRELE